MNSNRDETANLIQFIESLYAEIYGIEIFSSVSKHLLTGEQAAEYLTPHTQRAAVLFEENEHDFFIGVYLHDSIANQIVEDSPLNELTHKNMDSLCTVAEEISHFHLLLQRRNLELSTTAVELEFQAELDKLLVAAHLLYDQVKDPHISELIDFIFGSGVKSITAENKYIEANAMAASVWTHCWQQIRTLPHNQKMHQIRTIAKNFYHLGFSEKSWLFQSRDYLSSVA